MKKILLLLALASGIAHAEVIDYGPVQDSQGHALVDVYDNAGNQRGTSSNAFRIDPTGITAQPVTGTFWQATQPVSGSLGRTWSLLNTTDSVNVGNFPSTYATTQSGSWSVGRTWNLSSGTDSISASISNFPSSQAVTGTFWQATQPISAASLPLPSGASTSALQTTGNTSLATIASAIGSVASPSTGVITIQGASSSVAVPVSLSVVPLPTGASTSALQTTGNSSLATIATNTTPAIGSGSGTITTNQTVSFNPAGYAGVCVTVSGTWTGTLSFQAVKGGATVLTDVFSDVATGETVSETTTANGTYCYVDVAGSSLVQVTGTTVASGTATITFSANQAHFNYPFYARGVGDPIGSYGVQIGGVDPLANTFQFQHVNALGAAAVYVEASNKAAYWGAITPVTPPATPTDVTTLCGSATKTVRVIKVRLGSTQNTNGINDWYLVKRSTANTGGTSTTITPVPLDSSLAAATAVMRRYTTNATALGTLVGNIAIDNILSPTLAPGTSGTSYVPHVWDFTNNPIVLRGVAECLAVNFNGAALPGGLSVNAGIQWTEE